MLLKTIIQHPTPIFIVINYANFLGESFVANHHVAHQVDSTVIPSLSESM